MNLLTIEGVTKSYTDKLLLDEVDFSINQGDKIGIAGINGTGKSTLLKIIAGLEYADEGTISRGNNIKLRYLPQNPVFQPDDTILTAVLADNVTKQNEWSIESEAKAIIHRLELPHFDEAVAHISGGQKKRVALANALLAPVDILILDEPTNHLDNIMAAWLEEYLTCFRGAIVMVTHDRYFLDRVSNRIVEIDKGKLYNYPGSYSEFIELKTQRQDMELATERKRQSLLRTELEWLRRGARARSTKQKAHIQRIEEMQAVKAPHLDENIEMSSAYARMGKKTIEITGVCKSYREKKLIRDFTYIFLRNDRIGVIGSNGCGKTTLLKIICRQLEPDAGVVEIGPTIQIGYFSQENEYMDGSMRVIDYIKEVGEYVDSGEGRITAAQMLERFMFDNTLQYASIERLSGGEKRRLYLLRILMSAPNVLILDEPTNDLDIQTLTVLEDYLDGFAGIVITVSHDRYFLDRIARRIFSFEGDGSIVKYEGGYSDWLAKRPETEQTESTEEKKLNKDTRVREKKLKFSFHEQREYETIDDDIAELEESIEVKEAEIAVNASDYGNLNRLMQEKQAFQEQLEEKMERWVYLNDLNERIEAEQKSDKRR